MHPSALTILVALTLYSIVTAAAGAFLSSFGQVARRVIPFSGLVLIFISVFWVLPELVSVFGGWVRGTALLVAGVGLVYLFDRFIYPVCPTCSHTHDHDGCPTRLHGFAVPLIMASLLHSLFDGWALNATMAETNQWVGDIVALGIAAHRLAEGLAFGVILRAALPSRAVAVAWAVITQSAMFAGALIQRAMMDRLHTESIAAVLALGGGMFLYLGFHAVHGEWKRRSATRLAAVSGASRSVSETHGRHQESSSH